MVLFLWKKLPLEILYDQSFTKMKLFTNIVWDFELASQFQHLENVWVIFVRNKFLCGIVNYGFWYWGSFEKIQINCLFLRNALFLINCANDCSSCDIVLPKNLYRTRIE